MGSKNMQVTAPDSKAEDSTPRRKSPTVREIRHDQQGNLLVRPTGEKDKA